MSRSNAHHTQGLDEAKMRPGGSIWRRPPGLPVIFLLALAPPIRRRLDAHLVRASGQALAAKLARIVFLGRYRFYK